MAGPATGRRLRGALIGYGFIGAKGHVPAYLARSDTEITAVADICAPRRALVAGLLPGARVLRLRPGAARRGARSPRLRGHRHAAVRPRRRSPTPRSTAGSTCCARSRSPPGSTTPPRCSSTRGVRSASSSPATTTSTRPSSAPCATSSRSGRIGTVHLGDARRPSATRTRRA